MAPAHDGVAIIGTLDASPRTARAAPSRSVATHAARAAASSQRSQRGPASHERREPAQRRRAERRSRSARARATARAARRAARRRRARSARPPRSAAAIAASSSAPAASTRLGAAAPRRSCTARVRRSSSGASSRNAYGFALSSSCDSGDGSTVSRAITWISPRSSCSSSARRPVEVHRLDEAVARSSRTRAGDREPRAAPTMFSPHALRLREHDRQRVGRAHLDEVRRHPLAAAAAQHGQRARDVPAPADLEHRRSSSAWTSISSRWCDGHEAEHRRRAGSCAAGRARCTMPSSVAAACSSKSNVRQNFLRSARPHARLIRPPSGACRTSCMPPRLVEEALGDDQVLARQRTERARARPRGTRRSCCAARAASAHSSASHAAIASARRGASR